MSDSEKNAAGNKKAAKKKPEPGSPKSPKGTPSPKAGGKSKKDAAGSPSPELKKKKSNKDETEDQVSTLAEQEGSLNETKSKETLNSPKGPKKGAPKGKADAAGKGKGKAPPGKEGKESGKEASGKSKGKGGKKQDEEEKPAQGKEKDSEDEEEASNEKTEKKESCCTRYTNCVQYEKPTPMAAARPYNCCHFSNCVSRSTSPTCFRSCGMQCDSPRMSPCGNRSERATQCPCNRALTCSGKPDFFWQQPRQYTAPCYSRCQSRSPVPRTCCERSVSCSPPPARASCERFRACTACSCRPDWRPQTLARPRPRPMSSCSFQGASSYSPQPETSCCYTCSIPKPACPPRCPSREQVNMCCPQRVPRGLIRELAPNLSRCASGGNERNDYSLYNRNYSSPGYLSPRPADRAQWESEARAGLSTTELSPSGMHVVSATQRPPSSSNSFNRAKDVPTIVVEPWSTRASVSNAGIIFSAKSSYRPGDSRGSKSASHHMVQNGSTEKTESEYRRNLSARNHSRKSRSHGDRSYASSRPTTPVSHSEGWPSQATFQDDSGWGRSDSFHSESNRPLSSRNSQVDINSIYDPDYDPTSISQRDVAQTMSTKTESHLSKAHDDADVSVSSNSKGMINRSQMLQSEPHFSNRYSHTINSYCDEISLASCPPESSQTYREHRNAQSRSRVPTSCTNVNMLECGAPSLNRSEYKAQSMQGQYPIQKSKSFIDPSQHTSNEDFSSFNQLRSNQIYSGSRVPSQIASNINSELEEEGYANSFRDCDSEFARIIKESGCRSTVRQTDSSHSGIQSTTQHCPQVFTNCVCYCEDAQCNTVEDVGGNPRNSYKSEPPRPYRPASNAPLQDCGLVCNRQISPAIRPDDNWETTMEPPKSVANVESPCRRFNRESEHLEDTSFLRKTPSQRYNEVPGSYCGSSTRRKNDECEASQTALNKSEIKDPCQTRPFYQSAYSTQCNEKPPALISCMSFADLNTGTSRMRTSYKQNTTEIGDPESRPVEETKRRVYDYCAPRVPSVGMSKPTNVGECAPRCKMICECYIPQQEQPSRGEIQGSKFEVPSSFSMTSFTRLDNTELGNPYSSHLTQQYDDQAQAVGEGGASALGVYTSHPKLRSGSQIPNNSTNSFAARQGSFVRTPELSQGKFVNDYAAVNSTQKLDPARSEFKSSHASTSFVRSGNKLQSGNMSSYAQPSNPYMPSQATSRNEAQNGMFATYAQPSNPYMTSQATSRNEAQNGLSAPYVPPSNTYIPSQATSRNEAQNGLSATYAQPSNPYMPSQAASRNEAQNGISAPYVPPSNTYIPSQATSRNEAQNGLSATYAQPSNPYMPSQAASRNEAQNGLSAPYVPPSNTYIPSQATSRNRLHNGNVSASYVKSPGPHLSSHAP